MATISKEACTPRRRLAGDEAGSTRTDKTLSAVQDSGRDKSDTDNGHGAAEGGGDGPPSLALKDGVETDGSIAHYAWKSLPFEKLPDWLQDNEYLTHDHRPPMNSFLGCFLSMFRMHTETWNIWTHFLGFLFFLVLYLGTYVYSDYIFEGVVMYKLPIVDQAVLFCFFLAVMICLFISALFHLFSSHSQAVYNIFVRLDYTGIVILIAGSSIPAYYYGFYCDVIAQYTHITIFGLLCIICAVISLWRKFSTPKYRPLRFVTFVLFGLYGFVPGVHVVLNEGIKEHIVQGVIGLLLMGGMHILGAVIYVCRFPERFFPGRFNTWASSHQLLHVCGFLALLVHYDTLLRMVKHRASVSSCGMESLSIQTLDVLHLESVM